MQPEEILACPPRVLSQDQRAFYLEKGYLLVDELIDAETIAGLNRVTAAFVEKSRERRESDGVYDLAPGHCADAPRVRRLKTPDAQDKAYWDFACGLLADVAADLVGPNVAFHHSKLNFKWADSDPTANAVRWHQDAPFYPHTNYSPLTIGTYLTDVAADDGPLIVLPGSHDGPLYDHYDAAGTWTGCLSDADAAGLDTSQAQVLAGSAGSITVHNCRSVHASEPARSSTARPLLLNAYTSADAFAYTANPSRSRNDRALLRGEAVRWAHHDPRPGQVPPDWSKGYTSIFAAQAGEEQAAE
ncbi:phytanoyl-CoA dioxygenase family protein [Algihabitans albus]|uniref:phytanoyl-CoA dioxygenase family protein n=1 Tax=Algihabitans albus TaxID=2164067 RepID=UPI000E5D718C|nr:phytanoyl-CoA dioxygenase family protein [Algihabitans albus]